ncbi:MAG: ferrous iron transport protein A [Sandaracinaceae bacterium]
MPRDPITLADLRVGATGCVADVIGERSLVRRLLEMGVLPGTRVTLTRIAPLGDPLELRLRGYSLSVRRREAANILLEDVQDPVAVPALAKRSTS